MAEGLPYPDRFHVDAAQGWIGLGDPTEALVELDRIGAESQDLVGILDLRFLALSQGKRFAESLAVAERQIVAHPDEAQGWINRGNALFWLARYEDAHASVTAILDQFPGHWTLRYNLACYCIKLERFDEAKQWYEAAAENADHAELTALALGDPDMKELQEWVRSRPPKKSNQ